MAKKLKIGHRDFESNTERGRFTKICIDMMQSDAWQELSLRQRALYLEFKSKFTQKAMNGRIISDNASNISLPKSEAIKLYGDLRTFRADRKILIDKGFIKIILNGKNTRSANIYGFSDEWKKYKAVNTVKPEKEAVKI